MNVIELLLNAQEIVKIPPADKLANAQVWIKYRKEIIEEMRRLKNVGTTIVL